MGFLLWARIVISVTITVMIAQEWFAWTTKENADVFERVMRETIFPDIEATRVSGFRGAQLLRPADGDEVAFKILFYFESFEAGDDVLETAVFPPNIHHLLTRYERQAINYEVAVRVERPQGRMNHLFCDDELRHYIKANLRDFPFHTGAAEEGKRAAAVALTIVHVARPPNLYGISFEVGSEDQAAILLTRRSAKLKKHAGQWALPGGRIDAGESAEVAALRELEEEVGLRLGSEHILGRLDDYTTRSGFTIKPVVVWGGRVAKLVPNPNEVASIHRIPVSEFMRTDAPVLQTIPESEHPVLLMPVGESWIAAPTAAMLYQFREVCILGKQTRVAHFEQPYFAWK